MDNTVVVTLGITVVGMTLLFLTLVLFYGLLTLLTKVLPERMPEPSVTVGEILENPGMDETLLQAAALAAALARAELEQVAISDDGLVRSKIIERQQVSPWWALHHQRQLTPSSETRRTR